jgi:hypothetical protein
MSSRTWNAVPNAPANASSASRSAAASPATRAPTSHAICISTPVLARTTAR